MAVYLIHFAQRYKHAGHYIGYSADLAGRIRAHRENRAAIIIVHGMMLNINDRENIRTCVLRPGHADIRHNKKNRNDPSFRLLNQMQHRPSPRVLTFRPSKREA